MIAGISQNGASSIQELLRSFQKEQEDVLGTGAAPEVLPAQAAGNAVIQAVSANSASNIMSGNFASAERQESKYLAARKAGQEAANGQATRQMAILSAGLAELNSLSEEDMTNYAIRNHIGRKAARRMMEEGQQTVREESERNLKELKEGIEEKTQDATAPKDENGKPVESLPTGWAGEAAPMPEISGSNPASAPVAEVAVAPAFDDAEASAPVPEVATPVALAGPSINITV